MKCTECQVSHAPYELRPFPPGERALCLDCVTKERDELRRQLTESQQTAEKYERIYHRAKAECAEMRTGLQEINEHMFWRLSDAKVHQIEHAVVVLIQDVCKKALNQSKGI